MFPGSGPEGPPWPLPLFYCYPLYFQGSCITLRSMIKPKTKNETVSFRCTTSRKKLIRCLSDLLSEEKGLRVTQSDVIEMSLMELAKKKGLKTVQ